jgi:hypothetical protein
MATATLVTTVNAFPTGIDQTGRFGHLYGTIAIGTGGTYVTNGLPADWAVEENIYTPGTPFIAFGYSIDSGFVYTYDPTNDTWRIFQQDGTTGGLTEIANGASVTQDTVQFHATFQRAD